MNEFSGAVTSWFTDPAGLESVMTRSADGLTVDNYSPWGDVSEYQYTTDPEHGTDYLHKTVDTVPSGLSQTVTLDRVYADGVVTSTLCVNPDLYTMLYWVTTDDTVNGIVTAVSPMGRNATVMYYPDTLLAWKASTPGLFDTTYDYDSRGRPVSVATGT